MLLILIALIIFYVRVGIWGGTLGITLEVLKKQGEVTFAKFLGCFRSFVGRFIAFYLILAVALFGLFLIIGIFVILPAPAVRNFFLALLSSGALLGLILLSFTPYIIVVDNLKTLDSMNRSFHFTRENLLPAGAFWLILGLINLILIILLILFGFFLGEGWAFTLIGLVIVNAATSYLNIVGAAAAMTFYLNRSSSDSEQVLEKGL